MPQSAFERHKRAAFEQCGVSIKAPHESFPEEDPSRDPGLSVVVPPFESSHAVSSDAAGVTPESPEWVELSEHSPPPSTGVWKMPMEDGGYSTITFKEGQKHGLFTQWSAAGICVADGYFENDVLHGPCRLFDSLGHITHAFCMERDEVHGYMVGYYTNKVISYESWYVYGVQEGLMRSYDSFGDLAQECMYRRNHRHGTCVTYFTKTRRPFQIATFENGLQVGEEKTFYENGQLMQSVPYVGGCATAYPNPVDQNGKPLLTIPVEQSSHHTALGGEQGSILPPAPWDGRRPHYDTTSRQSYPGGP